MHRAAPFRLFVPPARDRRPSRGLRAEASVILLLVERGDAASVHALRRYVRGRYLPALSGLVDGLLRDGWLSGSPAALSVVRRQSCPFLHRLELVQLRRFTTPQENSDVV